MKLLKRLYERQGGPLGIAAIWAWLAVSYLLVFQFPDNLDSFHRSLTMLFLASYFVGMQLAWQKNLQSQYINYLGLALIGLSILGVGWTQPQPVYLILLVVFSGILPYLLSIAMSAFVGLVLFILTLAIAVLHWQQDHAFFNLTIYFSFSVFAFFAGFSAYKEARLREELDIANQQLLATQQLLTDSAVNDERLRISRDLHDAIGHHLTAMSLQLEVARKLSEGQALEHVEQARTLTKLLLADVRAVVSDLREAPWVDFRSSLNQLAKSATAKVNLVIEDNVAINKTSVIEAVFRLVQEIVTNSNRHSDTGLVNIHLSETGKDWCLLCDEGSEKQVNVMPGAGISGMRERVAQLKGQFELSSDKGIHYHIRLPKHD